MTYCLVVVDMQTGFESARGRKIIQRVKGLVAQAKRDEAEIVVLEYSGHGSTVQSILDLVNNYHKSRVAVKHRDDGSEHVNRVTAGLRFDSFVLCGVNTSACVKHTALGLRGIFPAKDIKIKLKACNQPTDWYEKMNWTRVDNIRKELDGHNITLIKEWI